jgi:hypothetical protein
MSLAKAHKARVLAQLAAEKLNQQPVEQKHQRGEVRIAALTTAVNHPQEVLLAALNQDLAALHLLTDVKKKIALKQEQLIPKWLPFIEQYRASGAHHPFEPLVWFAIWLCDAEQIDQALVWADFAINQQQKMPERFKTENIETFVAEQIHDWAQRQFKAGHSAEPFLTDVLTRIESNQWLVNQPIVLNKLYKLVAQYADKANELEKAEKYYLLCVEVNPKGHGVKGVLHAVQKKLGKPPTTVY